MYALSKRHARWYPAQRFNRHRPAHILGQLKVSGHQALEHELSLHPKLAPAPHKCRGMLYFIYAVAIQASVPIAGMIKVANTNLCNSESEMKIFGGSLRALFFGCPCITTGHVWMAMHCHLRCRWIKLID